MNFDPNPTINLPGQWSTAAPMVDSVFYFIYYLSAVLFVGIVATAVYFAIKYQRREGVKAEPTGHNTIMEVGWTVSPLFLLVLLFHWGFSGYIFMTVPPADALEIRVRARKWSWDFEYPNGAHTVNELHIPVRRPIRLVMSSDDVIHSFYVPAFRVKRDAVPGFYGMLWFEATTRGTTDFFCTEYCGAGDVPVRGEDGQLRDTGHFSMIGRVIIQSDSEYESFLEAAFRPPVVNGHEATPAEWGQILYRQSQCNTCHSIDGSRGTGPSWRGLFGREEPMTDGSRVRVDENYLRESILNPNAKVVQGYSPVMPTYRGSLRDRQIDAIIAYIRTLN